MQPEPRRVDPLADAYGVGDTRPCPNCRALMPGEMRFCRACGFRLGEGLAEFVETVRLPNAPKSANFGGFSQAAVNDPTKTAAVPVSFNNRNAAVTPSAPQPTLDRAATWLTKSSKKCGGRFPQWLIWVILANVFFATIGGGLIRAFKHGGATVINVERRAPRSFVGSNDFINIEGGVSFDYVTPDGPADKAGLLGGDIIKSFDGHVVSNSSELLKVMTATPVGKTVDVVFTRDGETKTAKLTTISEDEYERLDGLEDDRQNKGFLGVDDLDRVAVPGTNLYGVRVGQVVKNTPAYISDLHEGDIVTEFNATPIRTTREFKSRIERAIPLSTVKIVVMRGSERLEIPVKIGVDD